MDTIILVNTPTINAMAKAPVMMKIIGRFVKVIGSMIIPKDNLYFTITPMKILSKNNTITRN